MPALSTRGAILLLAGAGATYIALVHPSTAPAIAAAATIVALLHTLLT